ncbi:MAG: GIY-YIG nuclease family protein [Verrucomicrobiae bacterium]|nr:GIY-YIG nuclease family protein [Verrucomicrobiae bacterium]
MNLPDEKGTYILILHLQEMRRLQIGRLGAFDFPPGYYAYVGSACGPGGIRARIEHHLESVSAPHWHIDHLMGHARPLEIWFAISDRKLEQDWAELLESSPQFRTSIRRFGSSDYRRSRTTHLFYSKRRPSFRLFEQQVKALFEPRIQPQQLVLYPSG